MSMLQLTVLFFRSVCKKIVTSLRRRKKNTPGSGLCHSVIIVQVAIADIDGMSVRKVVIRYICKEKIIHT